ncbi:MAG: ribonuclease III family protein, partial [Clostridia bacterium]|nr:ribonuclease III family protein [Clostridia bacterium]
MEKIIYITEEIAKTLPAHTLVTVEKSTPTVTRIAGESITWLTDKQVTELEEKLGYVFRNKTLLTQAFTHSSCRPSHSEGDAMDNETLEFIGDRSLDLIITKKLISHYGKQQYTEEEAKQNLNGFNPLSVKLNEGELTLLKTQLVNTEALSEQASKLGLHNYLITGDT